MQQDQGTPLFGRWLLMFYEILDIRQLDVASRAGLSQPTVSKAERGEGEPEKDTIKKLWGAIAAIAEEQGWILDKHTQDCFLNAGDCVTERQKKESELFLAMFANAVKSKHIEDALQAQIKKQEESIAALKKEVSELRKELRNEKNRTQRWGKGRS